MLNEFLHYEYIIIPFCKPASGDPYPIHEGVRYTNSLVKARQIAVENMMGLPDKWGNRDYCQVKIMRLSAIETITAEDIDKPTTELA